MAARKRPLTDAPDRLTDEQRDRVREWCGKNFPRLYPQLGRLWHECRDWHLANGIQRADHEAAFRNWIRRAHLYSQQAAVKAEPTRRRVDAEDLAPLAEVIPIRRQA